MTWNQKTVLLIKLSSWAIHLVMCSKENVVAATSSKWQTHRSTHIQRHFWKSTAGSWRWGGKSTLCTSLSALIVPTSHHSFSFSARWKEQAKYINEISKLGHTASLWFTPQKRIFFPLMLQLYHEFCKGWRHYKTNQMDNIWVLTQDKLRQKLLVIQNKILS